MSYVFVIVLVLGVIAVIAYQRGGKAGEARLRGYGVAVDGSVVKSHGRVLGDLAGSRAGIGDMTSRYTATRVITVVGAFTKKTDAYLTIAFANGNVHQVHVKGAAQFRQASGWVARYNAMAVAERLPGQAIELGADGVPSIGPAEYASNTLPSSGKPAPGPSRHTTGNAVNQRG